MIKARIKESKKFIQVILGPRKVGKTTRIFAEKFHPEKVLLVGTGGIPYDVFLRINPKELF